MDACGFMCDLMVARSGCCRHRPAKRERVHCMDRLERCAPYCLKAASDEGLRYRKVGTTEWNEVGVPSNQIFVTINGLPPGDIHEPQVQFRTAKAKGCD